jgi:hypothetical protein
VPEGRGWRSLDTLQLRIRDGEDVILWVRFDEETGSPGTLSLVDPKSGQVGSAHAPGSANRLQTEAATVHLVDSAVDGPPEPRVTLTLALSFKPQAAGRTYTVEVLATDDSGVQQGFDPAGTLTVERR